MTTIVWDGKTLAADRQANAVGMRRLVTKIFKIDRNLVAVSGDYDLAQDMIKWMQDGGEPKTFPETQKDIDKMVNVLWLPSPDKIFTFERSPNPLDFSANKVICMGSGRDFAYGALEMGADAVKAVEVAIKYDTNSGMGVDTLTFD
jgi:20S proteasome alpha/beta subunit